MVYSKGMFMDLANERKIFLITGFIGYPMNLDDYCSELRRIIPQDWHNQVYFVWNSRSGKDSFIDLFLYGEYA